MKKTLLAFTVASFVGVGAANAQLFLSQDFNSVTAPALPTGWSSSTATGWKTGAPATVAPQLAGYFSDFAVASHSSLVGVDGSIAANNGVVLGSPAFTPVAGSMLIFDLSYFKFHLSADATKTEKLTFVVSTDGGTTWTDVSEVTANGNSGTWVTTSLPLGAYAGQSIKVGFRYENTSSTLVGAALDNVQAILGTDVKMISLSATGGNPGVDPSIIYAQVGSTVTLTGKGQNVGTSAVTAATTSYNTVTGTVNGLPANSLGSLTTSYGTPFTVTAGTTTIKAWVAAAGDLNHANDTATITVVGLSSFPTKKLLFEEATGTWCGYCPRGAVAMEDFASAHPGTAAQIAVHNSAQGAPDPMQDLAYNNYIVGFISGFPSVVVDRNIVIDAGDVATAYTSYKNNFGYADVTMGAATVNANVASVVVTVKPVVDIPNPKLALVATESNVTGTGSSWLQHNYYANNALGAMGGWETRGATVANVNFHFVGRSIVGSGSPTTQLPQGDAPSTWPATLLAGSTYTATMNITLDPTWSQTNVQYVAILNDGTTNKTLNTAFSALPTLQPGLPTAISNVTAGISKAQLYPNPASDKAYLEVDLKDAVNATLNITDAVGRTVVTIAEKQLHSGNNVIEVPTSALNNGLYFVNMITSKGNVSLKLEIVK